MSILCADGDLNTERRLATVCKQTQRSAEPFCTSVPSASLFVIYDHFQKLFPSKQRVLCKPVDKYISRSLDHGQGHGIKIPKTRELGL